VAAGGTLVQDIPSLVRTELSHSLKEPKDCIAHAIQITRGSRLHNALGAAVDAACTCRVNSRHHQAVKQIAPGLIVSATAPDGVIEAVEDPSLRFCLGVQWHPEFHISDGDRRIFAAFVAACRG
jgi:putative glutamine amidotransferase